MIGMKRDNVPPTCWPLSKRKASADAENATNFFFFFGRGFFLGFLGLYFSPTAAHDGGLDSLVGCEGLLAGCGGCDRFIVCEWVLFIKCE